MQTIFRIHYSHKINNYINLPFKSLWFGFLNRKFNNEREIVYVFMSSWYYPKFFNYILKKRPNSKLAFYFGDTIVSKKRVIKNLDLDFLKLKMNFVGSYNPQDVKDYNLKELQMCYSKYPNYKTLPNKESFDIIFIGAARKRMDLILNVYNQVKLSNLSYYFYVVSDRDIHMNISDKNFNITRKLLDYKEYLSLTVNAMAIVEITDSETKGGTLRFWDAIMYNKKLISNNKNIKDSVFFHPDHIIYTEDFKDINFKKFFSDINVDYKYNNENSPIKFLEKITKEIEGEEQ